MNPTAALAAYDAQLRRDAHADGTGARVERVGPVVRYVSPDAEGWSAVIWSDLDDDTADAAIAGQLEYFAGRRFEWKLYAHDQPADLGDRLRTAGFTAEEPESLMVVEIAELPPAPELPPGLTLQWVTDADGVAAVVAVHEEVFGVAHAWLGRALTAQLAEQRRTGVEQVAALLAVADGGRCRPGGSSSTGAPSSPASGAVAPCRSGAGEGCTGPWSRPGRPARPSSATATFRWTPDRRAGRSCAGWASSSSPRRRRS